MDAWGLVLLQLIFSGILTLANNKRLFATCLDMLNVIIHSLFVPDAAALSDRSPEDTKKIYNALNKKLRVRPFPSIRESGHAEDVPWWS